MVRDIMVKNLRLSTDKPKRRTGTCRELSRRPLSPFRKIEGCDGSSPMCPTTYECMKPASVDAST